MIDEKFSGTLGELLKKLEAGWGSGYPELTMQLAKTLREGFPEDALSTPVKVEKRSFIIGDDRAYLDHHEWEVITEYVPHRLNLGQDQYLEVIPGGFVIGYIKRGFINAP